MIKFIQYSIFCFMFLQNSTYGAPILKGSADKMSDQMTLASEEVKKLLEDIRIAAMKELGNYSDEELTKMIKVRPNFDEEDDSIFGINAPLTDELFEGDILLNVPQAKQILWEIEYASYSNRIPRQAQPDPESYWPGLTVPYTFHPDYKNDEKLVNAVKIGLNHVENLTCIRFTGYEDMAQLKGRDFLEYFRGGGCWSPVGRQGGGGQRISIGKGCEKLDVVAHETLHALGLWHEQSRSDRDDHILINFDAITPGLEYNFYRRTLKNSDNMGIAYDIGSTMHYPNRAFSKDRKSYTILTKNPTYQQTMGYRGGLSFKDAKIINKRYCSKICQVELECQNGGYTDPLRCEHCRCPEGYTGEFCQETPMSTDTSCTNTGFLAAGEWNGTISVPELKPGAQCYWRIVPELHAHRVELDISKMEFPCSDACTSYLEIKAKQDKVATGARLCCASNATIYGDIDTEVVLILKVAEQLNGTFHGFQLDYRAVSSSIVVPIVIQTIGTPTTTSTAIDENTMKSAVVTSTITMKSE